MKQVTKGIIKEIAALKHRQSREDFGLFTIEGQKGVSEAIAAEWSLEYLLLTEQFVEDNQSWLASLPQIGQLVDEPTMKRLSTLASPPGVLGVFHRRFAEFSDLLAEPFLVAFDQVSDPGNLGTMLRTADWFGVHSIILSPGCADLYNDKTVRSSMGSLFHLHCYQSNDWQADLLRLKAANIQLLAADMNGSAWPSRAAERRCLIMGSESHGLSDTTRQLTDRLVAIPGFGQAESLNVAVSFGILLYQCKQDC